jgi:hypothetical protein
VSAKIVSFCGTQGEAPALLDTPTGLRNLADNIEAGLFGDVVRIAYVIRSSQREPIVGALGCVEHIAQSYMDLHAGADQLMSFSDPERV